MQDAALIAVGIDAQGKRQVPGVSVALSEQEAPGGSSCRTSSHVACAGCA